MVIVTDDAVAYGELIRALDVTRAHGYARSALGGAQGIADRR